MSIEESSQRLKARIGNVKERFQKDAFQNEASISQQAVTPILKDLEWPTDNPDVVKYECPLNGGRADIALFHEGKPIVIVEVKKPSSAEGTEEQLFQYAYHAGVSLAVLTTGKEWEVYLPLKPGPYPDRQVYKLDISAREIEESANRLMRYLFCPDVCSGKAVKMAEADHGDKTRAKKIQDALPKAWREVLSDCDDRLIELLQDKVVDICDGFGPDSNVAKKFIIKQSEDWVVPLPPSKPIDRQIPHESHEKHPTDSKRLKGFVLQGSSHARRNGKDTLVAFFEAMIKPDSDFPDRFMQHYPGNDRRRWMARERSDLYGQPHLCEKYSHQLSTGHWISTNHSTPGVKDIIENACGVAGINYRKDLKFLY